MAFSLLLSNFICVLLLQHLGALSPVPEVLFFHVAGLVLVAHRGELSGNLLLVIVEIRLRIALNVARVRDRGRWVVLEHPADGASGRSSVRLDVCRIRNFLRLLGRSRDVSRVILLVLLGDDLFDRRSLRRCVLLDEIVQFVKLVRERVHGGYVFCAGVRWSGRPLERVLGHTLLVFLLLVVLLGLK